MRSRALGALLLSGSLGLASVLAAGAPAAAAPPVTAPDTAAAYQGNTAVAFPIKNDTDADNDLLTVCRLGTENYPGITASVQGDQVSFAIGEDVAPGVYAFTYYTCDFETLVPGTINVGVVELPDLPVQKAGRGRIKVTNPLPIRIRFSYGSFKQGEPDGQVTVKPGKTAKIRVDRRKVDWTCDAQQGTFFCGRGHVKGIKPRA